MSYTYEIFEIYKIYTIWDTILTKINYYKLVIKPINRLFDVSSVMSKELEENLDLSML